MGNILSLKLNPSLDSRNYNDDIRNILRYLSLLRSQMK